MAWPPHRASAVRRLYLIRHRGPVSLPQCVSAEPAPIALSRCLVSAVRAPAMLLSPWEVPPGLSVTPGCRDPADPSGTQGPQMPLPHPQLAPDTGPQSRSQSPPVVSATFGSPMGLD
ncbi:hypothetical protein NDU88_004327 [Pleurodeles waltl]|uniref:Uncharacterized protein n=1 Tax=Pleurodeles waltl TaxID=8319 RepID=A0AAV7MDR1_PLEWA|nr:hypothetical protein NDU88_004327 [Pleurodeles waltl]